VPNRKPSSFWKAPAKRLRQSRHNDVIRSMSARVPAVMPMPGYDARMFIGMLLRRSAKLECISAEIDRAWARAAAEGGHSPASGFMSFRYSAMASESHTARPRCSSTGSRPDGECLRIAACVSGRSSGMTISSKSMLAILAISQPRNDQDE
jgi:hypothetical protein